MTAVASPWRLTGSLARAGGRPMFGTTYEDPDLEVGVLAGRIVAIASAGDTAFALARNAGNRVTAVDIDPAQIALVAARRSGSRGGSGQVERILAVGRALAGWDRARLARFCDLDDPAAQVASWRADFDTQRFRLALAAGLVPLGFVLSRRPSDRPILPARFDLVIRRRLARGWASYPNRSNPLARRLLLGPPSPSLPSRPRSPTAALASVELVVADIAAYLETVEPRSVDGFALSNVLDGPGQAYAERLFRAVERAAAKGATVVIRSLAEPITSEDDARARLDRSHLWGRIFVGRADRLADWVADR